MEVSQAIRSIPFRLHKWKEFSKEIERAVDEIGQLDSEIKKLEDRNGQARTSAAQGLKAGDPEARDDRRAPLCRS